jgi:ribonuclease J
VEATRVLNELIEENILEIKLLQEHLHDDLGRFVYAKTRKRPLILPVVVEV